MTTAHEWRVGGMARRLVALSLVLVAAALLMLSTTLDWGMSPIAWVPALILLVLAPSLWPQRVLRGAADYLTIEPNNFTAEPLVWADMTIECCPTAGLHAVIAHYHDQRIPLATWLTASRAEALIAWLEHHAGTRLPRIETPRHRLDY